MTLGRVVIPKEIRRTMRIREGDPSHTTLTPIDKFCRAIHSVQKEQKRGEFHLAFVYYPIGSPEFSKAQAS